MPPGRGKLCDPMAFGSEWGRELIDGPEEPRDPKLLGEECARKLFEGAAKPRVAEGIEGAREMECPAPLGDRALKEPPPGEPPRNEPPAMREMDGPEDGRAVPCDDGPEPDARAAPEPPRPPPPREGAPAATTSPAANANRAPPSRVQPIEPSV